MELFRALAIGILVQAASNVSNTYWDFVNGKDTPVNEGNKPSGPVMAHKNVLTSGTINELYFRFLQCCDDYNRRGDKSSIFACLVFGVVCRKHLLDFP